MPSKYMVKLYQWTLGRASESGLRTVADVVHTLAMVTDEDIDEYPWTMIYFGIPVARLTGDMPEQVLLAARDEVMNWIRTDPEYVFVAELLLQDYPGPMALRVTRQRLSAPVPADDDYHEVFVYTTVEELEREWRFVIWDYWTWAIYTEDLPEHTWSCRLAKHDFLPMWRRP